MLEDLRCNKSKRYRSIVGWVRFLSLSKKTIIFLLRTLILTCKPILTPSIMECHSQTPRVSSLFRWLCLLSSSNGSQMRFIDVTGSHGPEFSFRLLHQWRYSSKYLFGQIFKLQLPQIDRLVKFTLKKGRNCLNFKKDLCRAYRQFPIVPKDYHLLGFIIRANFILTLILSIYVRRQWFANAQQRQLSISSPSRGP